MAYERVGAGRGQCALGCFSPRLLPSLLLFPRRPEHRRLPAREDGTVSLPNARYSESITPLYYLSVSSSRRRCDYYYDQPWTLRVVRFVEGMLDEKVPRRPDP